MFTVLDSAYLLCIKHCQHFFPKHVFNPYYFTLVTFGGKKIHGNFTCILILPLFLQGKTGLVKLFLFVFWLHLKTCRILVP